MHRGLLADPCCDVAQWVKRYRGHSEATTSHVRFAPKASVAGRKAECSVVPKATKCTAQKASLFDHPER